MTSLALRVVLWLVAASLPALAQSTAPPALLQKEVTIERDVPSGYGGMLRLTAAPHGGVQVSAWREQNIRIEARVELNAPTEQDLVTLSQAIAVAVDPTPTSIDVATKGPHDKKWMKSLKKFPEALKSMPWRIDYVVWVPEYTSLDLYVMDGETLVEGVNGIIAVNSVVGAVSLTNLSGPVHVNAVAGDVEIRTRERGWRGGALRATSEGGSIRLLVPTGFSANLDAAAAGGVTVASVSKPEPRSLGVETKERLGNGGAHVKLTAGGSITIEERE